MSAAAPRRAVGMCTSCQLRLSPLEAVESIEFGYLFELGVRWLDLVSFVRLGRF